ncbi:MULTISPECIES: hypothetical protein [unclassified Streptomyces]|uniref:hypothetical protein n=1 Tax=unclassified Streptomyces TaxID=2593676 RepID=UPI001661C7C6|nr:MULTISPECIES: hypothetical protein [unclassified Streptomyces]MBD0842468.1 hypothetical protein [Streptomyces sp. TRM68416]
MLDYVVACGGGALVGLVELFSRYRDRPSALLWVVSAWMYLTINAAASGGVLLLVHTFDLTFGATEPGTVGTTQVLVALFGAPTVLRSSLFTIRVGGQDIGIGPSSILSTLLSVADRGVDRARGRDRSRQVVAVMRGVSYEKARLALPSFCLALLQNCPQDEQQNLAVANEALAESQMSDAQKSYGLGLLLVNLVGVDLLREAVEAMGDEIRAEPPHRPPPPAQPL